MKTITSFCRANTGTGTGQNYIDKKLYKYHIVISSQKDLYPKNSKLNIHSFEMLVFIYDFVLRFIKNIALPKEEKPNNSYDPLDQDCIDEKPDIISVIEHSPDSGIHVHIMLVSDSIREPEIGHIFRISKESEHSDNYFVDGSSIVIKNVSDDASHADNANKYIISKISQSRRLNRHIYLREDTLGHLDIPSLLSPNTNSSALVSNTNIKEYIESSSLLNPLAYTIRKQLLLELFCALLRVDSPLILDDIKKLDLPSKYYESISSKRIRKDHIGYNIKARDIIVSSRLQVFIKLSSDFISANSKYKPNYYSYKDLSLKSIIFQLKLENELPSKKQMFLVQGILTKYKFILSLIVTKLLFTIRTGGISRTKLVESLGLQIVKIIDPKAFINEDSIVRTTEELVEKDAKIRKLSAEAGSFFYEIFKESIILNPIFNYGTDKYKCSIEQREKNKAFINFKEEEEMTYKSFFVFFRFDLLEKDGTTKNIEDYSIDSIESWKFSFMGNGPRYPMLCKPKNWIKNEKQGPGIGNHTGGYLLNDVNVTKFCDMPVYSTDNVIFPLVSSHYKYHNYLTLLSSKIPDSINYIQSIPKTIDKELWYFIKANCIDKELQDLPVVTIDHTKSQKRLNQLFSDIMEEVDRKELRKKNLQYNFSLISGIKKDVGIEKSKYFWDSATFIEKYPQMSKKINELATEAKICHSLHTRLVELSELNTLDQEMTFFLDYSGLNKFIYFPHNLDYRSRLYSSTSSICFQKSHWVRSVVRSSEFLEWDERAIKYVKIAMVKSYMYTNSPYSHCIEYFDKVLEPRVLNFISDSSIYKDSDSEEDMLALCFEYNRYKEYLSDNPDKGPYTYKSNLMISMDATSSGMQLCSLLNGIVDEEMLKSLNLLASTWADEQGDFYIHIFYAALKKYVRENQNPSYDRVISLFGLYYSDIKNKNLLLDSVSQQKYLLVPFLRKIFKTSIMTVSYGVSQQKFVSYIQDSYKKYKLKSKYKLLFFQPENEIKNNKSKRKTNNNNNILDGIVYQTEIDLLVDNENENNFLDYLYKYIINDSGLFKLTKVLKNFVCSAEAMSNEQFARFAHDNFAFTQGYPSMKKHKFKMTMHSVYTLSLLTNKLNRPKLKDSINANLIQSFESSVLFNILGILNNKYIESNGKDVFDILTVHDCFIVHPANIDSLLSIYEDSLDKIINRLTADDILSMIQVGSYNKTGENSYKDIVNKSLVDNYFLDAYKASHKIKDNVITNKLKNLLNKCSYPLTS